MLTVVGGFYHELCTYPNWDEHFGSGGRAAIILGNLGEAPALATYASDSVRERLNALASAHGFTSSIHPSEHTVRFRYYHGLSTPEIAPYDAEFNLQVPFTCRDDNIIRFGLIEGDAIVHGDYVVYDPQNVRRPEAFSKNGSTAKHLAIVLNQYEACTLAGIDAAPESLAKKIAESENAEVVIIKRGPLGALVYTSTGASVIPCYETDSVWPIGSGDTFVAYFGYFWMLKKLSAEKSAELASQAAAFYCWTRGFPSETDLTGGFISNPISPSPRSNAGWKPKVYLAGPFFTLGQRWVIDQARDALLALKFEVFSPFHDIGHGPAEQVVHHDIAGIKDADLLFAVVDGLDAGTLFEVGYGRALGKPVVVFCENESQEDLKMMKGSGCVVVPDFVTAIYKANWLACRS